MPKQTKKQRETSDVEFLKYTTAGRPMATPPSWLRNSFQDRVENIGQYVDRRPTGLQVQPYNLNYSSTSLDDDSPPRSIRTVGLRPGDNAAPSAKNDIQPTTQPSGIPVSPSNNLMAKWQAFIQSSGTYEDIFKQINDINTRYSSNEGLLNQLKNNNTSADTAQKIRDIEKEQDQLRTQLSELNIRRKDMESLNDQIDMQLQSREEARAEIYAQMEEIRTAYTSNEGLLNQLKNHNAPAETIRELEQKRELLGKQLQGLNTNREQISDEIDEFTALKNYIMPKKPEQNQENTESADRIDLPENERLEQMAADGTISRSSDGFIMGSNFIFDPEALNDSTQKILGTIDMPQSDTSSVSPLQNFIAPNQLQIGDTINIGSGRFEPIPPVNEKDGQIFFINIDNQQIGIPKTVYETLYNSNLSLFALGDGSLAITQAKEIIGFIYPHSHSDGLTDIYSINPLSFSNDTTAIDPSLYPQSIPPLDRSVDSTGENIEIPRDEFLGLLRSWQFMGTFGKVRTRGYEVEKIGNQYIVTKGNQIISFPFPIDAANYIYGTSGLGTEKNILSDTISWFANEARQDIQEAAAREAERAEQIKEARQLEISSVSPFDLLLLKNTEKANPNLRPATMGSADSTSLQPVSLFNGISPMTINTEFGPITSLPGDGATKEDKNGWKTKKSKSIRDINFDFLNFFSEEAEGAGELAMDMNAKKITNGVMIPVAAADALHNLASNLFGITYTFDLQEKHGEKKLIITGSLPQKEKHTDLLGFSLGGDWDNPYRSREGALINHMELNSAPYNDRKLGWPAFSWTLMMAYNGMSLQNGNIDRINSAIAGMSIPDRIICEHVIKLCGPNIEQSEKIPNIYVTYDKKRAGDLGTYYCYFDETGQAYARLRLYPKERIYIEMDGYDDLDVTEFFLEPYPLNSSETEYLELCLQQTLEYWDESKKTSQLGDIRLN